MTITSNLNISSMASYESDALLSSSRRPSSPQAMRRSIRMTGRVLSSRILAGDDITNTVRLSTRVEPEPKWPWILLIVVSSIVAIGAIGVGGSYLFHRPSVKEETLPQHRTGPYTLFQQQKGAKFLEYYEFYPGADSIGSAGYNTYVSAEDAHRLGLVDVDDDTDIVITSLPTNKGPRQSVRLEGTTRFDSGLFLLDVTHIPAGCGMWPAFWLTDEENWPDNGEIDFVEGVNYQSYSKTALHTSPMCSMYAHVPRKVWTGEWDRATGIPDTFTGLRDVNTSVPADDCWVYAAHQWGNQGCVAVSQVNDTLGVGWNANGGGVYVLQWDPVNLHIKSWVFPRQFGFPDNLQAALDDPSTATPDPDSWGLPYAYFAIGDTTGCSADHFTNMRLVLNTAFCGSVSGNRYFIDCPEIAKKFNVSNNAVESCNSYIASVPKELDEAYWKIRGVYVYQRAL